MFDDKEPQDIFADTDKPGAGPPRPPASPGSQMPPQPMAEQYLVARQSPIGPIVVVVLVLAALGGGGYFLYSSGMLPFLKKAPAAYPPSALDTAAPTGGNQAVEPPADTSAAEPEDTTSPATSPASTEAETDTPPAAEPPTAITPTPTEPVTPPEPATAPPDADRDGLSDDEEAALGSNPQAADTDNDGLSDFDEVRIYKSDPSKPDTDGDTYLDGQEVKNGYSPTGPGKLLQLPK